MKHTIFALTCLVFVAFGTTTAMAAGANASTSDEATQALAKDAAERGTPPWTNDSANINNQQPRTPPAENPPSHDNADFKVKPEWQALFKDPDHIAGDSGKAVYTHLCQACHMPDGHGAEGAGIYPSFAGDNMLAAAAYPITVVLHGRHGMPNFGPMLTDQQVADVVNYIRTSFGNDFGPEVKTDDVAALRDTQ